MIGRTSPRALVASLLLLGSGVWQGCARHRLAVDPLAVEYAGCQQVRFPGPVCVLDKRRELRLWMAVPLTDSVEIRAGRGVARSVGKLVAGGRRWVVRIPEGARLVEVRARGEGGLKVWSLHFGRKFLDPGLEAISQAGAKRRAGDHAAAVPLLQLALRRHRAAGLLLDEALDVGDLAYSLIQVRRFEEAREVLAELRLPAGAPVEAVFAQIYDRGLLAENVGDARTALAELDSAARLAERLGLASMRYMAEQVLGRQFQALGRSRDAERVFEHLASDPSPEISSCNRATMRVNQAWTQLLAGEAGETPRDPIPLLEEAQRVAHREKCGSLEEKERDYRLNRTMAHLQAGRLSEARRDLENYHGLSGRARPLDQLWGLDLEARLDVAEGDTQHALGRYGALDKLAARFSLPEGVWRAAFGRATCYEKQGRVEEALAEYSRAETLVDQESLQIPIQEGRETFAARRRAATDNQIDLLLRLGRAASAFEVARHDRSRVLRELARADRLAHLSLEEQKRWDGLLARYQAQRSALDEAVSADRLLPDDELRQKESQRRVQLEAAERDLDRAWAVLGRIDAGWDLPPLRSGEVVLAFRPFGGRWVGFAADLHEVKATPRFALPPDLLSLPAPERDRLLAKRLLVPFAAQIERATRVRVLAMGDLSTVDFHTLPFGPPNEILLDRHPVVYGLDISPALGAGAPRAGTSPASPSALIVGDPHKDLPAAYREAISVGERLSAGWRVESLLRGEAKGDAVKTALARADLFHYAGHGEVAGFGGWESELPLASGTRLTLGDLLALGKAPSWVVLSGCETGRAGTGEPVEGVSLAHAFLLAGSRSVIASTRKVGDAQARALFAELYRDWGREPDLALLLRRAQLAARDSQVPQSDWASFRVFEP